MNAPATITPARDRYKPIVLHHCPGCEGETLSLRCSLLLIRDNAASALRRCSDESAGVLTEVQRLAATYAFAPIPTDELKELRRALLNLTASASSIEAFAYRFSNGERDEGE